MKKKFSLASIVLLIVSINTPLFAGKDIFHYISLPLIEGAGIYTSIRTLTDDNSETSTKAAAVTNLALLGTNGALGLTTIFLDDDARLKMRSIHRVMGFTISAASIWLSVATSIDDDIETSTPYVSYGYSAVTLIPLFTFTF
jgi:heme A synthase